MKYTVVVAFEGMPISETRGLTKSVAVKVAKAEADSPANEGDKIFVTWFRASDQQHGYLNRGGDHEITGTAW